MAYRTQGTVGYPASPRGYVGSRSAIEIAPEPLWQAGETFHPFIAADRSTVTRPSAS
jgi:hypothetical protein